METSLVTHSIVLYRIVSYRIVSCIIVSWPLYWGMYRIVGKCIITVLPLKSSSVELLKYSTNLNVEMFRVGWALSACVRSDKQWGVYKIYLSKRVSRGFVVLYPQEFYRNTNGKMLWQLIRSLGVIAETQLCQISSLWIT